MNQLFPTNRIASDTCKIIYYYRASPDRTRVLFGGRVSATETNTTISGQKLYTDMCRIFPDLAGYKVTHSWCGTVAYTFDELAHTGVQDGVHYAMGYCGSGVSMASYLGMRVGQKVLGLTQGQTAFGRPDQPDPPVLYRQPRGSCPATVAWYPPTRQNAIQNGLWPPMDKNDRKDPLPTRSTRTTGIPATQSKTRRTYINKEEDNENFNWINTDRIVAGNDRFGTG